MKKKDFIVIAVVALAAVILFLTGLGLRATPRSTNSHKAPLSPGMLTVVESTPAPTPEPQEQAANPLSLAFAFSARAEEEPMPTLPPAQSYLRISTASQVSIPIPLVEDGSLKLTQGEGVENIIHVGENCVYMESSTCDNQDCVNQGTITLENKDTRVLFNMIICLPNQVTLELLTPEEAQVAWEDFYAAQ